MQINDAWNWIDTSFYGMMWWRNYFISRISTLFFICVDRLFTPYFKVDRVYKVLELSSDIYFPNTQIRHLIN